ncbi:hypothetical protein [Dactylosporangium sp. NPDC048998]|uniref:hypothetical protein n=1 Tax=Dactylosporangium sp. NPDC048998 TaxID=3363976 RepID=UPI00371E21A2
MSRRGRKRRLDVESEYWLLLGSGVGTDVTVRTHEGSPRRRPVPRRVDDGYTEGLG